MNGRGAMVGSQADGDPPTKKRKPVVVVGSDSPSSLDKNSSLWARSSRQNPDGDDQDNWVHLWKRWSSRHEVPRKLLHSSIGFITLHRWIVGGNPIAILTFLGKALVVIWSADVIRFKSRKFMRIYEILLGFLMRPSERHHWNGVIFYLLGVIFSLTALPADIGVLSILILSWVDTAASVFGRLYGHRGPKLPTPPFSNHKSLAGFLAAFTVGSFTALTFWSTWCGMGQPYPDGYSWKRVPNPRSFSHDHRTRLDWIEKYLRLTTPQSSLGLIPLSLGCGLVSGLAESLNVFGLDDNLVLPVLSGWGIWGLMKWFS